MKQPYLNALLCALVVLFVGSSSLLSQSGSVSGTVYDSDGKSTLPGASIYLKDNTSVGTASDFDGTYTLPNVPVGTQVLLISFTGFATKEVTVEIVEGQLAQADVQLADQVFMGETVIVTAQALGQAKAINQQLNSDAIANFVSADKIKELPDVNAAEAISRLPGVAINRSGGEGSKVVVRGLDPKFTAISINGVRLPSTSGTDRSVDLSLISPELLSGIELFKSPTADMDGDALGGSINLNIIKAPKERKASIKVLGGYNDIASQWKDYKATVSASQRILNGKLGITATANVERFNRSGERITTGWSDDQATILDTARNIFAQEGTNLRYTSIQEIRQRQNGSLGLDFAAGKKSDFTILGIYSRTSRDQFSQEERYDVAADRFQFNGEIRESSIQLFSGSLSARHKLNWLNVEWGTAYSQVDGNTPLQFDLTFRNDVGTPFRDGVLNTLQNPNGFIDFIQPEPFGGYLQGASGQESGNTEGITSGFVDLEIPFSVVDNVNATFKTGAKVYNIQKDRTFSRLTNITGRGYNLEPNTIFSEFIDDPIFATAQDPTGVRYYGIENFLIDEPTPFTPEDRGEITLLNTFDQAKIRRFRDLYSDNTALLREDVSAVSNNYDLEETVYAAYAQAKIKVGDKFTAIPGLRYEYSDNVYRSNYVIAAGNQAQDVNSRPTESEVNYGVLLPHLHMKYKPVDWLDFRASYSTTLARPDYNYVVPSTFINTSGDPNVSAGAPNLDPSVSTNYDFFVTAFSGNWGLLSGGVFYKDIKDAFYPVTIGLNDTTLIRENNLPLDQGLAFAPLSTFSSSPESVVKGFEIELQTNLNFLPGFLKGFVANFNYTRLSSETVVNFTTTERIRLGSGFPPVFGTQVNSFTREAALLGQAQNIFNASLGYDYKRSLSARVSASYQGDKISSYSNSAFKDSFNQGFWRFDAAIKKKFKNGLSLFLNLNNIGNQKDINFFSSLDRQFNERPYITSITRFGPTMTFGGEYKFSK